MPNSSWLLLSALYFIYNRKISDDLNLLTVSRNPDHLSNMRFNYHTAVLFGLFGTAISLDVTISPVARPTRGETIRAGGVYTIEWNKPKGISGPIRISLHNNELEDSASSDDHVQLQTISGKSFPPFLMTSYPALIHANSRNREQQRQIQLECQQHSSSRR